ncbi:hypothetical protein Tco_1182381 [Tanacetum coccineum]
MLELRDLPHKINQTVNEVVKEAVHVALQAPLRDRFRELPEANMKEILHQRIFESDPSKKKRHASDDSGSTQPPAPQSSAWKTFVTREAPSSSSKQKSTPHSEQPVEDSKRSIYFLNNTAYSVNSIRRIDIQQTYMAYSDQLNMAYLLSDTCMTRSSIKELFSPFENPEQKFCSRRRLFDTPSLVESNSPEFDHNFDILEQSKEEVREIMTETMEQYMSKTRENYGSGITRPTINQDTPFELKGQFLKELRDNTFSGSEHEDANEHIEKVLEIVDLFHIPKVTQDQIMLRAFPVSLTGAATKKMEEINNFQQEPDESHFCAWERFKELLMKCPQHYLTNMQEVILFYNGLDVPTRQIIDSKGVIPSKTVADA